MRRIFIAALFSIALAGTAWADARLAGDWRSDLGSGVTMEMNVTPNGQWRSETRQHQDMLREMHGTYQQTPSSDHAGTIAFTPDEVSGGNGQAQVETDHYELANNGSELRLTSQGDTMVFTRQSSR